MRLHEKWQGLQVLNPLPTSATNAYGVLRTSCAMLCPHEESVISRRMPVDCGALFHAHFGHILGTFCNQVGSVPRVLGVMGCARNGS
jgi:hypothetical protein